VARTLIAVAALALAAAFENVPLDYSYKQWLADFPEVCGVRGGGALPALAIF
jgi:hypothetical protein